MKPIAIIPARGGSKRIPRKNIKLMGGKPLINIAIEIAGKSGIFDQIIVTSDDDEIRQIAKEAGAFVPFIRPAELSDDFTPTKPVIQHAILEMEKQGLIPSYVCCIYPSAIFVSSDDYKDSFKQIMASSEINAMSTITKYQHPIQRALKLDSTRNINFKEPKNTLTRTQDLEDYFHDAGQFYWATRERWLDMSAILANSLGYIIDSWKVQDIDTQEDWDRAEIIYNSIKN
jgi:N-acylneuraminate cytidylyltransferase